MWSGDSTTTPDELEQAIVESGLDVLCITDHNAIRGAEQLVASLPCRVVVGEELRTHAGEIIGLFLTERVPVGTSPLAAAAMIREQGGLVYVPHPFDPVRRNLAEPALLELVGAGLVDAIEVRNAKTSLESLNRRAAEFAVAALGAAGCGERRPRPGCARRRLRRDARLRRPDRVPHVARPGPNRRPPLGWGPPVAVPHRAVDRPLSGSPSGVWQNRPVEQRSGRRRGIVTAFVVTVLAVQVGFAINGYRDPHKFFAFQPFNESSTWRADIVRVTSSGERVPIDGGWAGYTWNELVDMSALQSPVRHPSCLHGRRSHDRLPRRGARLDRDAHPGRSRDALPRSDRRRRSRTPAARPSRCCAASSGTCREHRHRRSSAGSRPTHALGRRPRLVGQRPRHRRDAHRDRADHAAPPASVPSRRGRRRLLRRSLLAAVRRVAARAACRRVVRAAVGRRGGGGAHDDRAVDPVGHGDGLRRRRRATCCSARPTSVTTGRSSSSCSGVLRCCPPAGSCRSMPGDVGAPAGPPLPTSSPSGRSGCCGSRSAWSTWPPGSSKLVDPDWINGLVLWDRVVRYQTRARTAAGMGPRPARRAMAVLRHRPGGGTDGAAHRCRALARPHPPRRAVGGPVLPCDDRDQRIGRGVQPGRHRRSGDLGDAIDARPRRASPPGRSDRSGRPGTGPRRRLVRPLPHGAGPAGRSEVDGRRPRRHGAHGCSGGRHRAQPAPAHLRGRGAGRCPDAATATAPNPSVRSRSRRSGRTSRRRWRGGTSRTP